MASVSLVGAVLWRINDVAVNDCAKAVAFTNVGMCAF
jgi:hypothetical protein